MNPLPSYFTVQLFGGPLAAQLMRALHSVEIETAIGQASIFRLRFELSRTFGGDYDALIVDRFRPNNRVTIRYSPGLAAPLTLINGHVRDVRVDPSNTPGRSAYEVVCTDVLGSVLAQRETRFTYPNIADGNAAQIIFARNGIMAVIVDPVPITRPMTDGTDAQRLSDAEYLIALAAKHGYELYIQPEPITGRDIAHLHAPKVLQPPQAVLSIDFGPMTNLTDLSVEYDALKPTTVSNTVLEPTTRVPVPVLALVSTELPMGLEPTHLRVLPPSVERRDGKLGSTPAEAQIAAQSYVNVSARAVRVNGRIDTGRFKRPLFVGRPVLIRGVGKRDSGLYQVDRVTHLLSADRYEQSFSAWRNAVGMTGAEVFIDPLSAA